MASNALSEQVVYQVVTEGNVSLLVSIRGDQLLYRPVSRIPIKPDQKIAYIHKHNRLVQLGGYDYVDRTKFYYSIFEAAAEYDVSDWDALTLGGDFCVLVRPGQLLCFAALVNYYAF